MTLRALLVVVAVVALPAAAAAQERAARKVAFLVGVGKYDHKFDDLGTAPENDVAKLADALAPGGFEVVTLTGRKRDGDPLRATKANIEARFRDVLKGTAGKPALRAGDTLLVFLCGHGVQAEVPDAATGKADDQPLFCPVDALPDTPATMVPLNTLIRAAEPHGATALFLVDACREVTDANRGTRSRSGIQGKKVNLPSKTAVLFACGAGQLSHQSETLAEGGHGLFTFAVLTTLKAADPKEDLSWTELVAGVQKTFRSAKYKALIPPGKPQVPVLASGELDDAPLLAARHIAARPAPKPDVPKKAEAKAEDKKDAKDVGVGKVEFKVQAHGYGSDAGTDRDFSIDTIRAGTVATLLRGNPDTEMYYVQLPGNQKTWVFQFTCVKLDK